MIESVAFQTRARTIDHLGREQIADCPTAVSELWKNSYDAYAREVALHIFDGDVPIAALVDVGHGMNRKDIIEKWFVIGTESKSDGSEVPEEDRDGLPYRPRQGQKGIGRLSSAALGSLLLLVSKRKNEPFVAALIDWRLFENPFIYLQDIEIPVVEFHNKNDFFSLLPDMFDKLMGNIWGNNKDEARDGRIRLAWESFDELQKAENKSSTREAIEKVLISTTFTSRHIEQWKVWTDEKKKGTALLLGNISFDLEAQLSIKASTEDIAVIQAHEKLFHTLSNFTDPFADKDEIQHGYGAEDFRYSVTTWKGALNHPIISDEKEFDYNNLEELEHVVDGQVDEKGVFKGRIRAFGKWLDGEVIIEPKMVMPTRTDTRVGSFHFRIGSFEGNLGNSTHTPEIQERLTQQSELHGGFMVFRNGLRVTPYGRPDNDFFEIETRRGRHAGREFWAYRKTFGRVALTRQANPNLRDKAGREGIIDNKASKVFRNIVENILMTTARRFFGTDAKVRKSVMPDIQKKRGEEKAKKAEEKIRKRKRKEFRQNLDMLLPKIIALLTEVESLTKDARENKLPAEEAALLELMQRLNGWKKCFQEMTLGDVPEELGSLEDSYNKFRRSSHIVNQYLSQLDDAINVALEKAKPESPAEIAEEERGKNADFIHKRLTHWTQEVTALLSAEIIRTKKIFEEQKTRYYAETEYLLDDLNHNRTNLTVVLTELEKVLDQVDLENTEFFVPYISTLKNLKESIDIEALVSFSLKESEVLREEVERLNGLAQLGITVEFIGHEREGFETSIASGLNKMPDSVKALEAFETVKTAYESLADRLRFLSPLKLSGEKIKVDLSGEKILKYVLEFIGSKLERKGIKLEATEAFKKFSVYERPARIYPVFINLINNASYWLGQSKENSKNLLLGVVDNKVVISDNGPGVEEEDIKHLFTLFFTRKVRGGRGVGLYLCRANLTAGGHTISYATDENLIKLPGANFVIDFKGARYD